MSKHSLQLVAAPQTTPVEFYTDDGEPPTQELIFALAGVADALDRLSDDDDARETIGNLSVAANVLAKQLAGRVAS